MKEVAKLKVTTTSIEVLSECAGKIATGKYVVDGWQIQDGTLILRYKQTDHIFAKGCWREVKVTTETEVEK